MNDRGLPEGGLLGENGDRLERMTEYVGGNNRG